MNNRERFTRLQEGLNLLMRSDAGVARRNAIPVTRNTTDTHWWSVLHLCRAFRAQGCEFIAEARFSFDRKKRRADIYLPELKVVVEVLHSESPNSLAEKVDTYAAYGVRTGWVTTSEWIALDVEYESDVAAQKLADLAVARAGERKVKI